MAFPWMLIPFAVNAIRTGIQASKTKGLRQDFERADAAVNPVDPNQTAFLNRLRTQEQRFRAGTDPSSAFAMQSLNQQDAQRQRNLLRAGGPGSVGNLLRSGQIAGQGAAEVGGRAAAMGNQLVGMQMGMTNLIADRVYERQRELSTRALGQWQQNRQDVQNAISGMTATLPDLASQTNWNKNAPQDAAGGSGYSPMVPNSPLQPPAPAFGPPAPQAPQWWTPQQPPVPFAPTGGTQQPSWYIP
jgi:hypothetical protein